MNKLFAYLVAHLRVIPADKANHGLYGGLIAAVVTILGLGLGMVLGLPLTPAPVAGAAVAWAFGQWKEKADADANAAAKEAGQEPPHSVEAGDVSATAWGGLLVAIPALICLLVK